MTTGSATASARKRRRSRRTHNPDEMTPSRRAGCGKSACPVRCGGGRRRSDGRPYTGTKLETADTAKGSLYATAPAPDPTVEGHARVAEEACRISSEPAARAAAEPLLSEFAALSEGLTVRGGCGILQRNH
jgi:hypothetical protein